MTIRMIVCSMALTLLLSACEKEKEKFSGEATINSTLYGETTYYTFGFSFTTGGEIQYPGDGVADFVVLAQTGPEGIIAFLDSPAFSDPFLLAGSYENESAAQAAFDQLLEVPQGSYTGFATPLQENQVWIYKSADYYGKIRILSVETETREQVPWASCSFEWVYQPDGSEQFPE